jgi:TonB-linked SusC/RagA family outer membrane protein
MKKIAFFLSIMLFMGTVFVNAQTKALTGKVIATEDKQPVPGVSVSVKGTTVGTVTNIDGEFQLSVPQDAKTLVFSFVGMKNQEIEIGTQTSFNISMEADVLGIDEVVVTALGISREKKSLGYSVQDISSEEISRANNPNLITSLSGKIAGVEVRQSSGMPGAPATVLIRGARSFDGNNQPLYVVDGMPITSNPDYGQDVTGSYNSSRSIDIDPNDIESINVLKGQAAAALYGLRASNGVIVITTKSGKGAKKGDPTVTLTTSITSDVVSRLPDVQQTYAQGYYEDYYSAYSYSWGPKISDLPKIPNLGGDALGQPGKWWDPYKGSWQDPVAYNNAENFFQSGLTQYYGANISNSTEIADYSIGLSATNQDGVIQNTGMKRYTAKMAASFKMGEKWRSGFSGNYSDVDLQKLPSGNDSYLFTVMGAPASFDLMGTPYHMDGPLGEYRQISYRRGAVGENPRWAVVNNHNLETTRRFFGNTYLEFKPAEWVNLRGQVGIDTYSTDMEDLRQKGSAGTGQVLPTAGDYTSPTKTTFGYRAPTGGSINNYGVMRSNINSLFTATFTHDFTEDLSGTLIIGNEFRDETSRSWTMTGTGFTIPGWNNMSNTTTQTADESKGRFRSVGNFANLAMDYKSMLYLNVTGRYDIVSSMPTNNRSFFYPSVSLGFVFTQLEALKDNSTLPYGKIRASFAQVGQAGSYNQPIYYQGGAGSGMLSDGITYPLGGVSGFRQDATVYDPNLKPQNTKNYELGIELKFLNNRLGVDYTYSDQLATDQIFSVPMAGSTGYSSFVTNAGEMSSIAHEVMLSVIPVQTSNFEWVINANYTKIKNEVVELAPGIESIHLAGYVTPNVRAYAGNTYPTIYGMQMARDEQGRILIDDDPDSYYYGFPMEGESGKIGDVSPDFIMGITNTFKYKFVTLSALLDWKQGGDIYSGTNRLMALYGSAAFTEDRTSTFQYKDTENAKGEGVLSDGSPNNITRGGPDDIEAYPDFYADLFGSIDEMAVYETSYLKLREVALTFDLPHRILEPVKMSAATISFVGRNFLLWTTLPNVDPETSQGMGNGQMGFEYMSLPQTKSYGVTLNLTF